MENTNAENIRNCKKIEKMVGYSSKSLQDKLRDYRWDITENIDINACLLQERFQTTIKSYFKTFNESIKSDNKWYNPYLENIKKERDVAHKKNSLEPSEENQSAFKSKRNQYVSELRDAEKHYTKERLNEAKGDNKKMWNLLKNMMQGNKTNDLKCIEVNGDLICSKKDIAETLNNFFVESVDMINKSIPDVLGVPNTTVYQK